VPCISEEQLQEFVNSDVSPQTLQSTLAGGRIEDVKRLLDEHFSSVANCRESSSTDVDHCG